ncbi:MAG: STAS domain-containing protein [Deltaproteobacteria bacterium]|nr:STAS domain-containing protein [Deltaproteobacteria bacterium]
MTAATITISTERLTRVMQVLSFASVDAIEQAAALLAHHEEDDFGQLEATLSVFLSELQQAQEVRKRQAEQLRLIESQQLAIRDLSTPIIDLWDDILTLPVVGVVDTQRSVEMTEKLLHRIVETRAKCVIIDITGVSVVDTMTADHFIKMVRSARLLGSYCVVTGISPEIAQTLVQSGVDIGDVPTLRSLKEGLKECFSRLQAQRERTRNDRVGAS